MKITKFSYNATGMTTSMKQFLTNEFLNQIKRAKKENCTVWVDAVEKYELLLSLTGMSKKDIRDAIEHEKEHFDEAIKQGLKPRLQIKFYKTENNTTAIIPSTVIKVPDYWSDEKEKKAIKQIAGAPTNPSEDDKKLMGL